MLLLFNIEPFKPLWTLLNYNSFSNKIFYCDSTTTSFRYFVKTQISVDIFFWATIDDTARTAFTSIVPFSMVWREFHVVTVL